MRVTFTLAEFIDAAEKNGYPQARGYLVNTGDNDDHIVDACFLGQAILNLGIELDSSLDEQLHLVNSKIEIFRDVAVMLNDGRKLPIKVIAARLRSKYKNQLNASLKGEPADYSRLENYQGGTYALSGNGS